jgi:hypothetical protein
MDLEKYCVAKFPTLQHIPLTKDLANVVRFSED